MSYKSYVIEQRELCSDYFSEGSADSNVAMRCSTLLLWELDTLHSQWHCNKVTGGCTAYIITAVSDGSITEYGS